MSESTRPATCVLCPSKEISCFCYDCEKWLCDVCNTQQHIKAKSKGHRREYCAIGATVAQLDGYMKKKTEKGLGIKVWKAHFFELLTDKLQWSSRRGHRRTLWKERGPFRYSNTRGKNVHPNRIPTRFEPIGLREMGVQYEQDAENVQE